MKEEEMEMATATQDVEALVVQPHEALALGRAPDVVLEEAQRAAKALMKVVEGKKRPVKFNGETYLEYEDWQTVGRFYGVTPMVKHTKYVEFGEDEHRVRGFEATADILLVANNQVISSAEAMCLSDEQNWARKPLFQLRSMAQTRACAKALRNVLAWVVVLAGFKPTPAEEMDGVYRNGRNEEGPSLPVEEVAEKLEWIANASSMDELKALFSTAYQKAADARDTKAMKAYIKAKDQRKAELS